LTTSSTGSKIKKIFSTQKMKNIKVRINRERKNENVEKSTTYLNTPRNQLLRGYPQQLVAGGCRKITLLCTFL
jgi:hypothetical protein